VLVRRPPLRVQELADRRPPFRLLVDGIIFGLSPYGGVITFWTEFLTRFRGIGGEVDLRLPADLVAEPPVAARSPASDPRLPVVFTSTYFTAPPIAVDAEFTVVHDLLYEDLPGLSTGDPIPTILDDKAQSIRRTDLVVVPSHSTAARLRIHYPDLTAPTVIVPHGSVTDDELVEPDASDLRLDEVPHGTPFLLHVGGRHAYKGFATVLRAFLDSELHRRFHLVVVGSEPDPTRSEREAIDAAGAQGRVLFLGRVARSELILLYRQASAVVCASAVEGFGLPAVEAAACGVPIACSRIDVFAETIGTVAHFFEPGDPVDCASAISEAITHTTGVRSDRASAIRRKFNWDSSFSSILAALTPTVERHRWGGYR